jgi:hypothetical protein
VSVYTKDNAVHRPAGPVVSNGQPSTNGTPPTVGKGVQLDAPSSSSVGSPTGLSDYQDYQGLSGLSKTVRDSQGVGKPTAVFLLGLPWEEFLAKAYEENRDHLSEIETDGDHYSTWQLDTPLFRFVHLVWSRPDLGAEAHRPATLFGKIEGTLKGWSAGYKQEKRQPPEGFTGDPWEEWFGISREEAKTEWLSLWPKFRFPAGQTPLDAAVLLARRTALIPCDEVCDRRIIDRKNPTVGYCFFLSVCGHLQALVGDKPIFLPQELLAKALRVKGRTISRWRQWAVDDGMLRQTARPGRRRAAEYRFDVSRWNVLENKAPPGTAEGFLDKRDPQADNVSVES